MSIIQLHNVKIPRGALYDFADPDRKPVFATPVFEFSGGTNLFPVLNGERAPFFLSQRDIVDLGGNVPCISDRLVGIDGRKVAVAGNVWTIRYEDGKYVFVAC